WPTNRVKTTLAELKSRLRTCFTFPDGIEDEDITISREIGSGKDRTTTQILNDIDLANIIWGDSFKGDLLVDFCLTADSYDQLPRFKGEVAKTPVKIRNAVIEEILRMHKVSPPITSANEATRYELISAIIYGVASIFEGEIKSTHNTKLLEGPIDWVIMIGDIIITVTEAKREDINQGVAQNTVMFGIVSTGVDWVIIKVVASGNNGEGNIEVFLNSLSPYPLPINHPSLDHEQLVGPVEEIFGQIKWVFDQQIETKGKQKRQRRE
ncbi:8181_t:CDS:2, partial [Ambispora gerdemannii]